MLREIPLQELMPSPSNPRKTFDQVKLEELARSIGDVGVLEPILVRDLNRSAPGEDAWHATMRVAKTMGRTMFEVVAGERRFRAATIAKVETVPCIVRELTDVQVLEIQTIENLQRDDLHPLEEAAGYAALMKEAGYDVDLIAQRISKSAKFVYDRLKLLQLSAEAQKVFLDGEITAGHAILLARLSPPDQQRAIGGDHGNEYRLGGLFLGDRGRDVPGLELEDRRSRKAVSVRELETWINDNVRFRPAEVDLPNLFPETAAAIAVAREEELKVVKITHDHRVPGGARDEKERTYGRPSWKRADGGIEHDVFGGKKPKPSKTCEHSVMGVVVGGPGRGEAFRVCVAKKKCKLHWAAEMKQAEQRANGTGNGQAAPRVDHEAQDLKWKEERRKQDEELARWKKAAPKLLRALVEKLQATPPMDLVDLILERCKPYGFSPDTYLQRGNTIEEAVRYGAFLVLSQSVVSDWDVATKATRALKPFGIDARKIVDQAAPKPKKPKKEAPAKAKEDAPAEPKKGARARRREKSADTVKAAD